MINVDMTHVKRISEDLISEMVAKHPDVELHKNYTIWINLWSDDTFQIKCVSGERRREGYITSREFKWYDGKITYEEIERAEVPMAD